MTSQCSMIVPVPTPPSVTALTSLSMPTTEPPCHTRTYRSTPEESDGSVPVEAGLDQDESG